jgi:hypothetical protein
MNGTDLDAKFGAGNRYRGLIIRSYAVTFH